MIRIPFIHELKLIKRCLTNVEGILGCEKGSEISAKEVLIHQNHFLRNHIQKLSEGNVSSDEISYGLKLASRHCEVQITGSDTSKIVVCTVATGEEYRKKVAACLNSQKSYSLNKNYLHAEMLHTFPVIDQRPASWLKIPLIYRLMEMGFEKIAFMDADCLITNSEMELEDYFYQLELKQKSILLAEDESGVNCGVLFVRKTPAAYRLLDLLWLNNADIHNVTWEQNALKEYLSYYPQIGNLIDIADSSQKFNRFPCERRLLYNYVRQVNEWSSGDFICHFAGIRLPYLEELINKYSKNSE